MRENFGHPMVAWRGAGIGMGALGDDTQTFLDFGFNSLQIQQIMSAHAGGGLSDAGYAILTSGVISPNDLADFMAADPGEQTSSGNTVPQPGGYNISPTQVTQPLTPGPAPRVVAPSAASSPTSVTSFFTGSTLMAGIPNVVVLGLGILGLTLLAGGGGRKR